MNYEIWHAKPKGLFSHDFELELSTGETWTYRLPWFGSPSLTSGSTQYLFSAQGEHCMIENDVVLCRAVHEVKQSCFRIRGSAGGYLLAEKGFSREFSLTAEDSEVIIGRIFCPDKWRNHRELHFHDGIPTIIRLFCFYLHVVAG